MNNKKKLIIINNEKVFSDADGFYCDNIEMKTIPEGLGNHFDVFSILCQNHQFQNFSIFH